MHGTELLMSSAYHPQTDGQSEVVNRGLETYLRCMCRENLAEWSLWLPLAEWWYSTHFHTSIQLTPYEVSLRPATYTLTLLGYDSANEEIDKSLLRREEMTKALNFHLERAQG